jgi:tRNA pseudouridine32 synthase / 23S rRNA pseudouridine746 synthase
VAGSPPADSGCIDLPLGRLDRTRGWWMRPEPTGQPALTRWQVLGRGGPNGLTWLALEPLTGRTHQLRVHCAAMDWPIVGDAIYGPAPRHGGPGLQLHAVAVVVPLYPRRAPIRVVAPVPPHLRDRLAACGWQPPSAAEAPGGPA